MTPEWKVWVTMGLMLLMGLPVLGALIGFMLCEPHRRETWDRPLPPKDRKP
jgi:hypothetical protein